MGNVAFELARGTTLVDRRTARGFHGRDSKGELRSGAVTVSLRTVNNKEVNCAGAIVGPLETNRQRGSKDAENPVFQARKEARIVRRHQARRMPMRGIDRMSRCCLYVCVLFVCREREAPESLEPGTRAQIG